MAIQVINQRQHLIIKKLKQKPCSYKELLHYLEKQSEIRGDDLTMSIRTFKRDRENILSTYGIDIEHDGVINAYKINNEFDLEIDQRIFEAFDLMDTLKLNREIGSFVHFDQRKASGTENMYGILHAIKNKLVIDFEYHKYADANATHKKVDPYLLKEFKSRWYLLAKDCDTHKLKIYGLDRINNLSISEVKFTIKKQPDIKKMFQDCFGIFLPDENQQVENIVLSFSPFKGKYIKSLPLHTSQKTLIDDEKEFRISLDIYITYDFIIEIISHSLDVKVIEPLHLAETIKSHHIGAVEKYECNGR
ncbi:MAG: helix-turn-helix transcriptional regulator [bacterium]